MSVIVSSFSLPNPASAATPTEHHQTQLQPTTASSRPRSNSNGDVNRLPPRYSTLVGTLPTTSAALAAAINAAEIDAAPPTALRPPRYSSVFDRTRDHIRRTHHGHTASDSLFASSSSGPQVHEYHIKSGGNNWATLRIMSRTSVGSSSLSVSSSSTSSSSQRVPRLTGSDLIQGSLELNLETPQNINSISLSFRGRVITSSYEGGSCTFLDQPIVTWARTNGDPRLMSPSDGAVLSSSSPNIKKFDGKLSGNYSWPFSLPFPKEVVLGERQGCPTPQTFLDRNTKGSVQYDLVLRFTHGILRSDSKLHANVVYVPNITPPPSSLLRQIAYGQNMILPRPDIDPSGWYSLPPATVRGRLLGERNVKLQCSLSLANPQSYTRGTVIPCHIVIRSSDPQALDLLATRKAIAVRLTRRVQYPEDAGQSLPASPGGKQRSDSPMVEDKSEVERAVWWCNPEVEDPHVQLRHLEGEIHLEKELQPSCEFSLFKVSYTVDLLPLESPVFRLAGSTITLNRDDDVSQIPIASLPVTIATVHGEGPVPVTFTKPQPRSSKKRAAAKTYTASTPMSMGRSYNF